MVLSWARAARIPSFINFYFLCTLELPLHVAPCLPQGVQGLPFSIPLQKYTQTHADSNIAHTCFRSPHRSASLHEVTVRPSVPAAGRRKKLPGSGQSPPWQPECEIPCLILSSEFMPGTTTDDRVCSAVGQFKFLQGRAESLPPTALNPERAWD